jgi:hypothetical protein
MRVSSRRSRSLTPNAEQDVDPTDDAGSGLFEACKARFAPSDYEVACDARHTVWVKRTDGMRSFGLPPWALRQHSLDELLEDVEKKLDLPAVTR